MVMESPTPRLEIFIIPLKLKKLISQVKNFHNLKKPRDTGINSWMFHTNAICAEHSQISNENALLSFLLYTICKIMFLCTSIQLELKQMMLDKLSFQINKQKHAIFTSLVHATCFISFSLPTLWSVGPYSITGLNKSVSSWGWAK